MIRRLWRAPLLCHAGLALVLLTVLGGVIGTHTAFTDDEGNVMAQARAIEHGAWALPSTFPTVDPSGHAFPMANITLTPRGVAPLAKHLVYTSAIARIDRVFGPTGVLFLSILAAILAALCSAWLARRYGRDLDRICFWLTIVATPLFFYSVVLTGQTLGAACVSLSVVALISYLRGGGVRWLFLMAAATGAATAAREEALIWTGAACAGLLSTARWRRSGPGHPLGRTLVAMVIAAAAGLAARVTDVLLSHHLLGRAVGFAQKSSALLGGNHLRSQLSGAYIALLGAGEGTDPLAHSRPLVLILTLSGLIGCVISARVLLARRRPALGALLAVCSSGCFVARWAVEPTAVVSGILAASPLVLAGVCLTATIRDGSLLTRFTVVTGAIFTLGVAASVYSDGGGLQWGGRYFVVEIPVLVPLLVSSAAGLGRLIRAGGARMAVGAALVLALVAGVGQETGALVASHRLEDSLLTSITTAAADAVPGDGQAAVVLTTVPEIGVLWSGEEHYRMLLARNRSDLALLGHRLISAGVRRVVLVSPLLADDARALASDYRIADVVPSAAGQATAVLVAASAQLGANS